MNNQKTVLVFSDGMLYSVEGYLAEKIRRAIDAINRPKTVPSKEASSLNRKCDHRGYMAGYDAEHAIVPC